MEVERERPPAYVSTNPDELKLPSVPQHELGAAPHSADHNVTLPGFKSVIAGIPERTQSALAYDRDSQIHALRAGNLARLQEQSFHRTLPGIDLNAFRTSSESAMMSPTETGSMMSVDDPGQRSTSVVSLEDPDVRMAAEALSGLGNPDFARTRTPRAGSEAGASTASDKEAEPLLSLLVEAHPWLGGTVKGSLSAYTTTKNYSPRILRYGTNVIERNMVSAVSTVGRRTGVESGLRRYLDSRRPSDIEQADSQNKRRKFLTGDGMDVDEDTESAIDDSPSRAHYEYLPAYRRSKPPSYREEVSPNSTSRSQLAARAPHNRSWSTKLIVSTSGLSIALSEASLNSLKYCVNLLTKATEHIAYVMNALKMVLQDYEKAREERQREQARFEKDVEAGLISRLQAEREEATRQLADRIKQMCDDIWSTLKTVVDTVTTYAGAALPENARRLVKVQVLSIPKRWQLASQTAAQQEQQQRQAEEGNANGGESSKAAEDVPRQAAHRMIVFAQEGLDMMGQVNEVCKITLQSAEDWLSTFGRRPRSDPHTGAGQQASSGADDVQMSADEVVQ